MTTVLLIRHSEVENRDAVLYGRLPRFPLSAAGRAQAARVAAALADEPVAAIYSSPLLRARQTADAIAARRPCASRHRSRLLIEVGSRWDGTPFRDFPPGFSTYAGEHADDETMAAIRDRMLRFLRRAEQGYPGQTIVAVSHGDPITILRVALLGLPLELPAIRGAHYAALGSLTCIALAAGTPPRLVDVRDPLA